MAALPPALSEVKDSMSRFAAFRSSLRLAAGLCVLLALIPPPAAHAGRLLEKADRQAERTQPLTLRPSIPFDPSLAADALSRGHGRVRGVLFHKIGTECKRGLVLPAKPAGEGITISLFPVTPYLTDYVDLLEEHRYKRLHSPRAKPKILAYDPRLAQYALSANTDQFGRFEFEGLRPGRYWLNADASIKCYFDQPVKTGTSEVRDGYYVLGQVDHYTSERRYWETFLNYRAFIEVGADGSVVELESELRPVSEAPNVQVRADDP